MTRCYFCDTEFTVDFDTEDAELLFCPSCGEELPDIEDRGVDEFFQQDYEE